MTRRGIDISNRIAAYIKAWALQNASLEDLRLDGAPCDANWYSTIPTGFNDFEMLRTLDLGTWSESPAFLNDVQPPPYLRELWVQPVIIQARQLNSEDQDPIDGHISMLQSRSDVAARFRQRGCDQLRKLVMTLWFTNDAALSWTDVAIEWGAKLLRWEKSEQDYFDLFQEGRSRDDLSHIRPEWVADMLKGGWARKLWDFKEEEQEKLGIEVQLSASVFWNKQLDSNLTIVRYRPERDHS